MCSRERWPKLKLLENILAAAGFEMTNGSFLLLSVSLLEQGSWPKKQILLLKICHQFTIMRVFSSIPA
jgi:hypothetical protein